jgi:hypothetical protein
LKECEPVPGVGELAHQARVPRIPRHQSFAQRATLAPTLSTSEAKRD